MSQVRRRARNVALRGARARAPRPDRNGRRWRSSVAAARRCRKATHGVYSAKGSACEWYSGSRAVTRAYARRYHGAAACYTARRQEGRRPRAINRREKARRGAESWQKACVSRVVRGTRDICHAVRAAARVRARKYSARAQQRGIQACACVVCACAGCACVCECAVRAACRCGRHARRNYRRYVRQCAQPIAADQLSGRC